MVAPRAALPSLPLLSLPLLSLLSLLLAAPALASEHLDREPVRPTILDRTCLDRVSVDPTSGGLRYGRTDLSIGEGPDRFVLERTWVGLSHGEQGPQRFGAGWASLLDLRVLFAGQEAILIRDERGILHALEAQGEEGYTTLLGRLLRLSGTQEGWRLTGRERGEELHFDAEGRLRECRRYGHRAWTIERDEAGQPARVRARWGELSLIHDGAGLLREVQGPGGLRLRYGYEQGRLLEVARGARFARYDYDEAGRLDRLARGQGLIRYDGEGRVAALAGPGLVGERFRYARTERGLVVERSARGVRARWEVGARRIVHTLPTGGQEVIELDERARPARRTRGEQAWTWRYDAEGRLVEHATPQGTWRYRAFKAFAWGADAPSEVSQPSGATLRFRYDDAGRVTGIANSAAGKTLLERDEAGRVTRTRHPHGAVDARRYDARGYLVAITRAGAEDLRIERAADGSARAIAEGARETRFSEEAGGRLLRETEHGRLVREVYFGPRERTRWIRDAKRGRTTYRWDLAGRLVSARDEGGLLLRAGYDREGRLSWLEDAAANTVRYRYPSALQVVVADPTRGQRSLERDRYGRIVRELRAGAEVRYTYDQGRLSARKHPRGEDRYVYDALGRLLRLEGPDGGYRLAYDAQGRLERLERTGARRAGVRFRYDPATGAKASAELPWGAIRYAYDARGRLAKLTTPAGGELRLERDASGERSAVRYPNGAVTRYVRELGLLRRIETRRAGALLSLRAYDYDAVGRPNQVRDETGATLRVERDARGRVVRASEGEQRARYVYDAADNRGGEGVEIAAGNRVRAQGELKLRYDASGALTEIAGPEGARRFDYDLDGHLIRARTPQGEVRYGYAPNGLRLWREAGGERTDFLSDGRRVVGELVGGRVRRGYVHGDDGVDDLLAASVHGEGARPSQLFAHHDLLQSVVALSDGRGERVARFRYGAFGESRAAEGPAAAGFRFRYTGREHDELTGLYHYRARSYAPELGRFTSPDPSGRKGGLNLYAYVLNDPVRFVDPYGLRAETPGNADAFAAFDDFSWWDLWDFAEGFGEGVADAVAGIADAALDLEGTWDTIKRAFRNPREFIEQIAQHYGERFEQIAHLAQTDSEAFFREVGKLAGEAAVGVAAGGALGAAARSLGLARRLDRADGRERDGGERAGETPGALATTAGARAPGPGGERVGAADRLRGQDGRGGGGCFLAGTLVQTRSGPRPIEQISAGDEVLSRDERSGEQGYKPVVRLFRGRTGQVVTLQVAEVSAPRAPRGGKGHRAGSEEADDPAEQTLRCTREHPFWVRGAGWLRADELAAGDLLRAESGADLLVLERAIRAEAAEHYNFEVADWHTYFVSQRPEAAAVWVHNACFLDKKKAKVNSAQVGDRVRTPSSHAEDFVKRGPNYVNRHTGEVWQRSHTNHSHSEGGEWKVGIGKGNAPSASRKITVRGDGTIHKIDR